MKKRKLLPQMAVKGVMANGTVYYPYLAACIFAAFTYFVFASILQNDLVKTLPRAAYAWMLLLIGKGLLGIILLFYLVYANSFLIKRRKKEIGLYSLLGLEKKHIGIMLLLENLLLYGVSMAGGMILGTVLSKLFFLLLLKLSNLPVNAEFVFTAAAFKETLIYFGVVFIVNYGNQLKGLLRVRPAELFTESRKGEKEPKFLNIWTIAGVILLLGGYSVAVFAKVDSMIFINFFLAVLLVVAGTYFLFTSGSIAFLKLVRRSRKVYYRPANFITISGMYYRMKKNAASLVNICIFSTMVIITLICTCSLYMGMEGIVNYQYPYDIAADFTEGSLKREQAQDNLTELEKKYGLAVQRMDLFTFTNVTCYKEGSKFSLLRDTAQPYIDNCQIMLVLLEDYNRMTDEKETLSDSEVLLYSTGVDFGYDVVEFMGITKNVKKEIFAFFPYPKADKDGFNRKYLLVVKDTPAKDELVKAWAEQNGVTDIEGYLRSGSQKLGVVLSGKEEEKQAFVKELTVWCQNRQGFTSYRDGLAGRNDMRSMNGGLLFIGIVFGMVFFLCLIIIMYYKQISEGYEDSGSFSIMQKVGMSDGEIKSTIHRQILLVFGLPLAGALMHTAAGLFMVDRLMATIQFFNTKLLLACTFLVCTAFVLLYGISYLTTAKTYYRIVKNYQ